MMNGRTPDVKALGVVLLLLTMLGVSMAGYSAPGVPASDSEVLARVGVGGATTPRLAAARQRLAADPDNVAAGVEIARIYLEMGRTEGDPRFISYAQAALTPWLSRPNTPQSVLVLAAVAEQNLHRFDEALAMLDRALALSPSDGQAWLVKASLLQTRGDFSSARRACSQLIQTAGQLVAVTCLASANGMTGRLAPSYASLQSIFRDDARLDSGLRGWVYGELADMAQRAGNSRAAENHFRAAMSAAPDDSYHKGAYADFLLLSQRPREVIALLNRHVDQDALLLRLAIAAERAGDARAARWSSMYEARLEAARARGDKTHDREHARFLLDVRNDSQQALQLAQRNWQVQREPEDIRLYVRAALAARNEAAQKAVQRWISEHRYEDHTLSP